MTNPNSAAELLFHLQALLSRHLIHVSSNLQSRSEIAPGSITSSCNISRLIGEDIFNTPVDATYFDAEIGVDTKEGKRFSFSMQLGYDRQTWILKADVSEIEQHGGTVRSSNPQVSSPNLTEITEAADSACEWLIARASDFQF